MSVLLSGPANAQRKTDRGGENTGEKAVARPAPAAPAPAVPVAPAPTAAVRPLASAAAVAGAVEVTDAPVVARTGPPEAPDC